MAQTVMAVTLVMAARPCLMPAATTHASLTSAHATTQQLREHSPERLKSEHRPKNLADVTDSFDDIGLKRDLAWLSQ